MADALYRPLTRGSRMRRDWTDGRSMAEVAAEFIRPNDRLTSFERLEIYNRDYWFRVLDSLIEDFPGLRAVMGVRRFDEMAEAYLWKHPSESYTLRDLGGRLEKFLLGQGKRVGPRRALVLDMARFEWAQVEAFDNEALPVLTADDVLDADAATLRLKLQPYVRLLELDHPVDNFLIALKRDNALRGDASNTAGSRRRAIRGRKIALPRPEKIFLVVHRHDNDLYYKRLEPVAFRILEGLRDGRTLENACERALDRAYDENINWPGRINQWFSNWMSLGWFASSAAPAARTR